MFKEKSVTKGIKVDNKNNRFCALSEDYADNESEDEVGHNLKKEIMREIKECNAIMYFLQKGMTI